MQKKLQKLVSTSTLLLILLLLLTLLSTSTSVFAQSSSSSYKIYGGQVESGGSNSSSASYGQTGGAGSSAQGGSSSSYNIQSGSPVTPVTASSGSSGGSGGSGGSSGGGGGGSSSSSQSSFSISGITITNLKTTEATINFSTSKQAETYIEFGTNNQYNNKTQLSPNYFLNHSFTLFNLAPNTRYDFRIIAKSKSGETQTYVGGKFTTYLTLPDLKNVTNFQSRLNEQNQVDLSWTRPDSSSFRGVYILKGLNKLPKYSEDAIIYRGNATNFTDSSPRSGVNFYVIYAFDSENNVSSGVFTFITYPPKQTIDKTQDSESTQTSSEPSEDPQDNLPNESTREPLQPEPDSRFNIQTLKAFINKTKQTFYEFFPADPLPIPEDSTIEPSVDATKNIINLYSILRQNVRETYEEIAKELENLTQEGKEQLIEIREDIYDSLGKIRPDILLDLTPEQRQKIEEILDKPIPSFSPESVAKIIPVEDPGSYEGAQYKILAGSQALISVKASVFEKPVDTIIISFFKQAYVLKYNPENDSYETYIDAPLDKGRYGMILQIIYNDNTYEELDMSVLVDPYGYVYTKKYRDWSWSNPFQFLMRDEVRIPGATISLYTLNKTSEWVLWPANLYGQSNPIISGSQGEYSFIVPDSQYYIEVNAANFSPYQTHVFEVNGELINMDIYLDDGINFRYIILAIVLVLILLLLRRPKKA